MKTFAESVEIAVPPARVWQALTRPDEVVCWDTGIVEPLDAPPDYPKAGQHVRWQYRLGPLPLVLYDHPTRVEPTSTFASTIRLGPFDFKEIYTLRGHGTPATELTAELSLTSRIPLLGSLIERVLGARLARATVRTSLAAIKRHCEDPGSN
jgi:hypothetical protein